MSQQTLFWLDYETFGIDPRTDRPAQFAGVRTDLSLHEIEPPVRWYCQLAADALADPEACLITGITPQYTAAHGLLECEFMDRIHQELSRPGTCGVGYNSIRFDDEFTRFGLYRNFFDPYSREWAHGNSRWDIIDLARMCYALCPRGTNWPLKEDGSPSFRLEHLAAANDIEHTHAHDALDDVRATLGLAVHLRQAQPRLFHHYFALRLKRTARRYLDTDNPRPLLHTSGRYPAASGHTTLVFPLAKHPANGNGVLVYDLTVDPTPFLGLDAEQLVGRLFAARADLEAHGLTRLPIKTVHLNRSPAIAPAAALDRAGAERLGINGDRCRAHLKVLRAHPELGRAVVAAHQTPAPTGLDVDEALYTGFFGPADRQRMALVRATPPEQLAQLSGTFSDSRLEELLWRYRARNFPATLTAEEQRRWRAQCRSRLSGAHEGVLSAPDFQDRLRALCDRHALSPQEIRTLARLWRFGQERLQPHGLWTLPSKPWNRPGESGYSEFE
ncbi:MAG: exodeoxyribonuclease I [Pseudomonadota bacterium]|nr:exodeoxyribonuclease I [Pseudomonadota bacterium]